MFADTENEHFYIGRFRRDIKSQFDKKRRRSRGENKVRDRAWSVRLYGEIIPEL